MIFNALQRLRRKYRAEKNGAVGHKERAATYRAGMGYMTCSVMLLTACAPTNGLTPGQDRALAVASQEVQEARMSWTVGCETDPVTAVRTCSASTSGRRFDGERPYGLANVPFDVRFTNGSGPYFSVGLNTYPGRTPTVRVDSLQPVLVYKGHTHEQLVKEMLGGKSLLARYYVWPDGAQDMYVKLDGFKEAWGDLTRRVANGR